jgi:hypothetical protein
MEADVAADLALATVVVSRSLLPSLTGSPAYASLCAAILDNAALLVAPDTDPCVPHSYHFTFCVLIITVIIMITRFQSED